MDSLFVYRKKKNFFSLFSESARNNDQQTCPPRSPPTFSNPIVWVTREFGLHAPSGMAIADRGYRTGPTRNRRRRPECPRPERIRTSPSRRPGESHFSRFDPPRQNSWKTVWLNHPETTDQLILSDNSSILSIVSHNYVASLPFCIPFATVRCESSLTLPVPFNLTP